MSVVTCLIRKTFKPGLAFALACTAALHGCKGDNAGKLFTFDSRRDLLMNVVIQFVTPGSSNSDQINIDPDATYTVSASIIYDGASTPIDVYRQGSSSSAGLQVLGSEVGTQVPIVARVPQDFNASQAALYFSMDLPAATTLAGSPTSKLSAIKVISVSGLGLADASSPAEDDATVLLSVVTSIAAEAMGGLDGLVKAVAETRDLSEFKTKIQDVKTKVETVIKTLQEDVQTTSVFKASDYIPALFQGFVQHYNSDQSLKAELDTAAPNAPAVFQDVPEVRQQRMPSVATVFQAPRITRIEEASAGTPTVTSSTPETKSTTPTWTWGAVSGAMEYRYRLNSSDMTTGAETTTSTSYTPSTPLADGTHILYVQAKGSDGIWSSSGSSAITVDTTPPGSPGFSGSTLADSGTPTWSWGAVTGAVEYRYRLNNSDMTSGTTSTTATSFTPSATLSDGTHTLYVQARDEAGNWSTVASRAITVDTTAPSSVTISGAPTGTNSATSLSATVAGTGVTHYKYKFGPSSSTSCSNATGYSGTEINVDDGISENLASLADGDYTLCVIGRDAAGNWQALGSASSVSWTKNTAPSGPTATLSGVPTGSSALTQLNVTVQGTNVTSYKFKVGVSTTTDCSSATGYSASTLITTNISSSLSAIPIGSTAKLCVIGGDSSDAWQSMSSATTTSWTVTCAPGRYPVSGVCTPVGVGYYSTNGLTRSACTNLPSNAAYLGTTGSTATCPFACDSGYAVTSAGDACEVYTGPVCNPGYYPPNGGSCTQVGAGYYSSDGVSRMSCIGLPDHARWSDNTASSPSCSWVCNSGYSGSSVAGSAACTPATIVSTDIDDQAFAAHVPFPFKFFGVDYGNDQNGGIAYTSNNYLVFGVYNDLDWAQYSGFSAAAPGRGVFMNARDNWMTALAMDASVINGVRLFRIVYEGYQFGADQSTIQNLTVEIFENQKINVIYGVQTSTTGVAAISNGSSYFLQGSMTPASNTVFTLSSDADGNNWTSTPGLYQP